MIGKAKSYINYKIRPYGHLRFAEPIVVFESDDWGLAGRRKNANWQSELGEMADYAADQLESIDELEALYSLFEKYQGTFERQPFITANFIVSNPDFTKTIETGYRELHLQRIDDAYPQLFSKWKEGLTRKTLYPQYHGRLHYNYQIYTGRLKNDNPTRYLFEQSLNAGKESYKLHEFDLHTEYVDWERGRSISNFSEWLKTGLKDFNDLFGYSSASTICPNYSIQPENIKDLREIGIQTIQAGNKLIYKDNNNLQKYFNYCFGSVLFGRIAISNRNVRFEPCRGNRKWGLKAAINKTNQLIEYNLPVIIDTHRMNYVGDFAKSSLRDLDMLLESLSRVKNVRFLSSSEIGEAILNDGRYRDIWTGEQKALTPIDSWKQRLIRRFVS